jgi:hypothetical protein
MPMTWRGSLGCPTATQSACTCAAIRKCRDRSSISAADVPASGYDPTSSVGTLARRRSARRGRGVVLLVDGLGLEDGMVAVLQVLDVRAISREPESIHSLAGDGPGRAVFRRRVPQRSGVGSTVRPASRGKRRPSRPAGRGPRDGARTGRRWSASPRRSISRLRRLSRRSPSRPSTRPPVVLLVTPWSPKQSRHQRWPKHERSRPAPTPGVDAMGRPRGAARLQSLGSRRSET